MFIRGGAAIPSGPAARPYVRVALRDDQKILGVGEATPWPAVAVHVAGTTAQAIGNALPVLGYVDLDELSPIEAVGQALARVQHLLEGSRPARFALETALLDVIAQRRGTSVAGAISSSRGPERVPCNALLDAATDDLPARAVELAQRGYLALKVKLRARTDADFDAELAALRALRLVWPHELRLDPNGAWFIEEARTKMARLAFVEPRYVEQPVPAEQLVDLGRTAVPWAADESLLVPGLPERLAASGICAAFILKPALLGGLSVAMDLAKLAVEKGVTVVTTHALDGPVGIAAASEFALAQPAEPQACGLDLHAGLSAYPSLSLPHHRHPGHVVRAQRSGLGFTDEERRRWAAMA